MIIISVILDANTMTHSDSDKSIFNQSTFKLRYIHYVFRNHAIAHLIQFSRSVVSNTATP